MPIQQKFTPPVLLFFLFLPAWIVPKCPGVLISHRVAANSLLIYAETYILPELLLSFKLLWLVFIESSVVIIVVVIVFRYKIFVIRLYIILYYINFYIHIPSQQRERLKVTLEEWVFVESAFIIQCYIVKIKLLHTAFSAIFAGLETVS